MATPASTAKPRGANVAQLRDAIDRGRTGSKVNHPDPAAAPLGTDEEAAGTPPSTATVTDTLRRQVRNAAAEHAGDRHAWARTWLPWIATAAALLLGAITIVATG